jgi:hypothetical protein
VINVFKYYQNSSKGTAKKINCHFFVTHSLNMTNFPLGTVPLRKSPSCDAWFTSTYHSSCQNMAHLDPWIAIGKMKYQQITQEVFLYQFSH